MAEWLSAQGVRLVVLAGYMHLLTPAFLDRFPERRRQRPSVAAAAASPARTRSRSSSPPASASPARRCTSSTRASTPARCSRRSASPSRRRHAGVAARAHQGDRAPAASARRGGTVRALISTYDKTGLDVLRARPRRARLGARRERRHRRVPRGGARAHRSSASSRSPTPRRCSAAA